MGLLPLCRAVRRRRDGIGNPTIDPQRVKCLTQVSPIFSA